MITRNSNKMFTRNSRVFFTTNKGTKIVRMSPRNVAALVADFVKKSKSVFKEEFTFGFGGENFEYSGFKVKVDGEPNFALEFAVN